MLMRRFSILAIAILATAVALGSAMAQLDRPPYHQQGPVDPIITSSVR